MNEKNGYTLRLGMTYSLTGTEAVNKYRKLVLQSDETVSFLENFAEEMKKYAEESRGICKGAIWFDQLIKRGVICSVPRHGSKIIFFTEDGVIIYDATPSKSFNGALDICVDLDKNDHEEIKYADPRFSVELISDMLLDGFNKTWWKKVRKRT